MKINSLGFRTNFIFSKFSGVMFDRGTYTVIKTPSNPDFHWGNYLIFDRPPQQGDLLAWKRIFDTEFPTETGQNHYVFAWEDHPLGSGECEEFLRSGFELEKAVVLIADKLDRPPRLNSQIEVRKIDTPDQWHVVTEQQIFCADPKYVNARHRSYKERQMASYRKMSDAGLGFWFGAYLDGKLVGDLGIFCEYGICRYQVVETHPSYRNRGVCGTLVYQAGLIMAQEFAVQRYVLEADPEYHAARIYESVGFQRSEVNYSLSWWRQS